METRINASSDDVFGFFERIEELYEDWHPDHITFRWIDGEGLAEGNQAYFEEEPTGELKKFTVRYTKVTEGRYIEFQPTSRLVRLILPQISFRIEPEDGGCLVTQRIRVRTGPIGRRLKQREFDAIRHHMKEEGENLKRMVEAGL